MYTSDGSMYIRFPFRQKIASHLGHFKWPEDLPVLENLVMDGEKFGIPEPMLITPSCRMPNLKVLLYLRGSWFLDIPGSGFGTFVPKSFSPNLLVLDVDSLDWCITEMASESAVVRLKGQIGFGRGRITCQARRLEMFYGPQSALNINVPFDHSLASNTLPNVTELFFG